MKTLLKHTFSALGSQNEIALYLDNIDDAPELFQMIEGEVRRIEQKFSRYLPESIVSQINQAAGKHPVAVDQETAQMIDFAFACYLQSGKLFDFTSGVLRRAWNFREAKLPETSLLKELLPLVGSHQVSWKLPHILLMRPGMEIDFGGFGKEYAVDQAINLLAQRGVTTGYVNLGGDLRVLGTPPDRDRWTFGIAHPRISGQIAASLDINSGALASSGDYERFIEIDSRRYCHILNPFTGYPADELQSVSVIAPAAMIAGSCSTIAMLSGKKKGERFLKKMGFPYLLIDQNGNITHG